MFFKVNTFFFIFSFFSDKLKKYFLWILIFNPILLISQESATVDSGVVFYGKASYYDEFFNGRKTANGEIFSHKQLTAAHPSWPFNTKVKVTNLVNKNSVTVRINDRGPFIMGRHIDLSKQAATVLGFIKSGVVDVKMEIIKWGTLPETTSLAIHKPKFEKQDFSKVKSNNDSNKKRVEPKKNIALNHLPLSDSIDTKKTNPEVSIKKEKPVQKNQKNTNYENEFCFATDSLFGWCVQIGSYSNKKNAEKAQKTVSEKTNEWSCIQEISRNDKTLYRVICGKNIENNRANEVKNILKDIFPDAFTTNFITLKNNS